MKRRIRGAILTTIAMFLVAASQARAYQFSISDPHHRLSERTVQRIERAVSFQANRQLGRYWRINPVSFGTVGIPLELLSGATIYRDCMSIGTAVGCRDTLGYHEPTVIEVDAALPTRELEVTVSHEILETEVDRSDAGYEVCDPVNGYEYPGLGGVWLSDFMVNRSRGFLQNDLPVS